ncbi:MAG: TlpA family protein disulfide reductase [Bacteroidota bacterium]
MRSLLFVSIIFLFSFSNQVAAQKVQVFTFSDFQDIVLDGESPLTVVNFWATWCAPCIKELPYFQSLDMEDDRIKVYLVSLDFKKQLEKVEKFVSDKEIKSEVLFMDERDPDTYLGKVSPDWSGAIPATLFITDLGKKYFHEKAFSEEELKSTVEKYLK